MRQSIPLFATMFVLVGCTTTTDTSREGNGSEQPAAIAFKTGPCFGSCPMFEIEVNADGQGIYRGERFVAVEGERAFTASAAEWRAFADRLAPYRPDASAAYGHGACDGPIATDQASIAVTWRDAGGGETTLDWYTGCDQPGLAEHREAIMTAWRELPLDDLVGTAEDRFQYDRD